MPPCSSLRWCARLPCRSPRSLRTHLGTPAGRLASSVAAPGFLNMQLDPAWVAGQVGAIREQGDAFGQVRVAEPHRINVEFVSANPTGPLTVGNARGAFVGDLLSRVLEAVGHEVAREYYFNDFNAQVRTSACRWRPGATGRRCPRTAITATMSASLRPDVPDDVWARGHSAEGADPGEVLGRWASERVRAGIEASLAALGVRFDVWKTEGSLHDEGWVPRALDKLRAAGDVYEADGATWFRARSTATRRIGSSSAATASRPTSRRTSATSRRSSAAASTS